MNRDLFVRLVLSLTLLLSIAQARAATIWVSPAGGGDGSAEARPTSLSQAQTSALPGDVVMLRPGAYASLTWTKAGTATAPITIRAKTPAVTVAGGVATKALSTARSRFENGLTLKASYLTLDGIYTGRPASVGVYIYNGQTGVTVRQVHAFEPLNSGINIYGASKASTGITIEASLLENNDPNAEAGCGEGCGASAARTDYGVRLYRATGTRIIGSVFKGFFNHGISLKEQNPDVEIAGNRFDLCGSWCIEAGQQRDFDDAYDKDQTSGFVRIAGNTFAMGPGEGGVIKTIQIVNQRRAELRGNQFTKAATVNVSNGLGQPSGTTLAQWAPEKPLEVLVTDNSFVSGTKMRLIGRGVPTSVDLSGNNGSGVACSIEPFKQLGSTNFETMPDLGPPTVTQAGNGFVCK